MHFRVSSDCRAWVRRWARAAACAAWATVAVRAAEPDAFWKAHVAPLLEEHCSDCHHPGKTKGGLDLSSPETLLRGGDRGTTLVPGRPEDSLLSRVLEPGADPHMPPRHQLGDGEREVVARWIRRMGGTPDGVPATEVGAGPTPPAELTPLWTPTKGTPASEAVDGFLRRAWRRDGVRPARGLDDAGFLRRVTLDLAGRVPTGQELALFLADRGPDRRERWVDTLLGGPEYPRHFREIFDVVLMGRGGERAEGEREEHRWFDYLETVFRENRPWDRVVRDLVVARPVPEDRGAAQFLWERKGNPQAMAEALAPVAFGVQIQCAQCHDHMVAREIKQAHYWGMVAAFNRSRNVDAVSGFGVAESAIGGFVTFANLRKESQPARLVFFNGRTVDEPWPAEGEKEVDAPGKYRVPPPPDKERPERPAEPVFSRRSALAEAVTVGNPLLARAMVNRVWAILFGRGLVHPVELMDSKHPPSHPELLDWLAEDFAAGGHDVRALVRALVLTRAYALDSRPAAAPGFAWWRRWTGRRANPSPASPDSFARALTRPLSAEQYFRSLVVATGNGSDSDGRVAGRPEAELRRAFVKEFPDLFAPDYNATLQQAMFLANSPLFAALLEPRPGNLMERVAGLPDAGAQVEALFRAAYGRPPDREERSEAVAYLRRRSGPDGASQLAWALLTGAEFQLNH